MFAPAKIPVAAGKKMAKTEKNVSSPRKSGPMFSHMIAPSSKTVLKREQGFLHNLQCQHYEH